MTVLGQVDGVVAEPAADVENVAVDPAAGLPPDDTLGGRRIIKKKSGHRRHAFARAFATVKGIKIDVLRSGGCLGPTGGGERDNWDGSRRLALVLSESRIPLGLQRVLVVAFGALQLDGMNVDDVVADFDAGVGAGLQVLVPGGVVVGTGVRGEHQIPVAVGEVHHDVGPRLPAACTDGVQDDQRRTLEPSADPTVIGAELGDIALVEVVAIAHRGLLISTDVSCRSDTGYPVAKPWFPPVGGGP